MYFWKIENLKEDIKTKQLTEKDRFIYMFIFLILTYFIILELTFIPSTPSDMWEVMSSFVDLLISSLGTFLAFRANGGAMGVDFLGKYFSISFVVSLRFIPLAIFLVIITELIGYFFSALIKEEINTNIISFIFILILEIALSWRIIKHIKDVKDVE